MLCFTDIERVSKSGENVHANCIYVEFEDSKSNQTANYVYTAEKIAVFKKEQIAWNCDKNWNERTLSVCMRWYEMSVNYFEEREMSTTYSFFSFAHALVHLCTH